MGEPLASFSELDGLGSRTEVRLHSAGVYSWRALAEVLGALRGVWVNGKDPLGDLTTAASRRADEDGGDPDGERSEAFIVRLAVDRSGRPIRSSVTHVRSRTESPWPGWFPDEVIRFIEDRGRLAPRPSPDPGADGSGTLVASVGGGSEHVVDLDAGRLIGGGDRDVDLRVGFDSAVSGAVAYRATLRGRTYGPGPRAATTWVDLAAGTGTATPPEDLRLSFPGVTFPAGVHRLRLRMRVRLSAPQAVAPTLALR